MNSRHFSRRAYLSAVFLLLACMSLACCSVERGAFDSRPYPTVGSQQEEVAGDFLMIPSNGSSFKMRARVYKPAGDGPFRLVIINHGSAQDPSARKRAKPPEFTTLTDWFLKRGYVVVLPERPGHANGGKYLEDQGGCADANFERAGQGTGDSIAAVVDYMRKQPFILRDGIVIAGHSAGAWGGLAYAARRPAGVSAVINFAGGRGGHHLNRPSNNCAPERLVATAALFGKTTSIPTLWIYAASDTYFPPPLPENMVKAFRQAGGSADFVMIPTSGGEGHFIIRTDSWQSALQKFLDAHG